MTRAWLLPSLLLAAACADPIPNYPYEGSGGQSSFSQSSSASSSSGGTPVTHAVGTGCSLANGIVAWWPGEGTPLDIVGMHNGVWASGTTPLYREAKIGEGFVFDGTGYVQAPFTQAGGPLTVDLWALSSMKDEGTYDATFSTGDVATAPYFQIDSDGLGNWRFFSQDPIIIGPIADAVWQHLAITYDGSTVSTYIDGQLKVATSWKGKQPLAFATFKIGSNRNQDEFFKGTLDEVHVWNRALTAAEISTLAGITTPTLCLP